MASFTKSLAKGFVRSTVNQVGRDAGKVISNNVYGDRHSTPYRNVSTSNSIVDTGEIRNEGTQVIEPSVSKAILCVAIAFFFSIIGAIVLLIVGFNKLRNKYSVIAWQYQSQSVYVADGRRKNGMRYDGDNLTRRKIRIDANDYEIELNEKIAKIYLWAGFVFLVLFVTVTMAANGLA